MNTDETRLPELTRRQEEILSLIIRAYSLQPEPVSSKSLVEKFSLRYSTATIRNEMSVLEDLGYIIAPHTSAGRVPTENGYRYFVQRLLTDGDLSQIEQSRITEKLQSLPLVTEQWMRVAASIMARTAQTAALVTPPIAESNRFKHIELIAIQGRLALMVLVLQGGTVHQQMLTLPEPMTQSGLTDAATRLNALCTDMGANEIRIKTLQLSLFERDVAELVAEVIEKADTNQIRIIYRDGVSDVIGTFANAEGAQQAVRVFEERAFLNTVINDFLSPLLNQVQVVIAGNGKWDELSQLSLVLSRYGIPGQVSGTVGVLGPTHINYSRAISIVGYVSNLMTNMLSSVYESDDSATPPALPDETGNNPDNI